MLATRTQDACDPNGENHVHPILRTERIALRADARSALHLFHAFAHRSDGQPALRHRERQRFDRGDRRSRHRQDDDAALVMQRLDRTVMVAYIFNPRLSVTEFYQHLATLFDIRNWETKSDLLFELGKVLDSRHSRGLRTVLIVDEAHGLSTQVLEEIRLLCNFESDTAKQMQIVLTGQPELREVLNNPELRQLKQRVALRCEIRALPNVEETAQYINSRLKVAGATRPDIFSPGAIDYIFRCTAGIPRAINNLCDNALLNGFAPSEEFIRALSHKLLIPRGI